MRTAVKLELISKTLSADQDTSQLNQTREILNFSLISNRDTSEIL